MMWWLVICLIFIIIIFSIFLARLSIRCQFIYDNEKQMIYLSFNIFSISIIRRQINLLEEKENDFDLVNILTETFKNKSISEGINELTTSCRKLLKTLNHLIHIFSTLIQKTTVHQFKWQTYVGTGNASSTGMVAGGLWGVKGYIMRLMYNHQRVVCEPTINVYPLFQQKELRINASCMVSIRIGQAIYIFLKVMRKYPVPKHTMYSTIKGG